MHSAETNDGSPLTRQARWVDDYRLGLRVTQLGSVSAVGDGIAWVTGLPSAAIDDILHFGDGSIALVFDLTPDRIGAVLLVQTPTLTAGTVVEDFEDTALADGVADGQRRRPVEFPRPAKTAEPH